MFARHILKMRRVFVKLVVMALCCVSLASASATLLLEEPYGKMGVFTATGHAAVYLSGVCADTPLVLRHCAPGETGVVLSRYDGIGGYDWVAIPLIPYLYAVERPQDVPLFANAKMAAFLRDRYRRKYLEDIAPDIKNGETPGGNWYQLVGSSYDRAIYGFEIGTTPDQDDALIRKYNGSPNHSHFHLVTNNCADFAKAVINFYYPKSLHRSLVADVGITTPKQIAKMLTKFSAHHRELEFSRLIISQVPGSMPRSTNVHGVVESFFKAKKYIVPSLVVSPIFAGCVAAVYVGTGAGHFDPARQALVFNAKRNLETPLGAEDRRSYQSELSHLVVRPTAETHSVKPVKSERLFHTAAPDVDAQGRPVLLFQRGEQVVSVGVSGGNILDSDGDDRLTQELLLARFHGEPRPGSYPKGSESAVARDWELLKKSRASLDAEASVGSNRPLPSGSSGRAERTGNRP